MALRGREPGATGCDCGAGASSTDGSLPARGTFVCDAGSPAGLALFLPSESNEGRKVEDHDHHQTRQRSAQAR